MPDLLEPPPRLHLPMFAYGPDKPDQPAYDLLDPFVVRKEPATLPTAGRTTRSTPAALARRSFSAENTPRSPATSQGGRPKRA